MRIQPEFPEYHHNDPKRQAELRVYQEIANSQRTRSGPLRSQCRQAQPRGRLCRLGRGCSLLFNRGEGRQLLGRKTAPCSAMASNGPEQVSNPLPRAMDGTLSIRNAINDQLEGACYIISILLFPDMEDNPEIRRWAQDSRTNVMFGTDSLVRRLTELEDVATVRHRPPAYRIEQEVAVLMPEAQPEANQAAMPRDLPTALHAQHMVIQNLTINLYASPLSAAAVPQEPQNHGGAEEGEAGVGGSA